MRVSLTAPEPAIEEEPELVAERVSVVVRVRVNLAVVVERVIVRAPVNWVVAREVAAAPSRASVAAAVRPGALVSVAAPAGRAPAVADPAGEGEAGAEAAAAGAAGRTRMQFLGVSVQEIALSAECRQKR